MDLPRYTALLLKAIREGEVHDWESLTKFQRGHDLTFISWGSRRVGQGPAVIDLLRELKEVGLVLVEGIDINAIWVRRDSFSKSPPGRVVYDPSHPDALQPH